MFVTTVYGGAAMGGYTMGLLVENYSWKFAGRIQISLLCLIIAVLALGLRQSEYLKCDILEHGFLRVRCEACHDEKLLAFSWPFLDGVYADNKHGTSGFHRLKAPTNNELIQLTHTIAHRVGRYLERQGLLLRDTG